MLYRSLSSFNLKLWSRWPVEVVCSADDPQVLCLSLALEQLVKSCKLVKSCENSTFNVSARMQTALRGPLCASVMSIMEMISKDLSGVRLRKTCMGCYVAVLSFLSCWSIT